MVLLRNLPIFAATLMTTTALTLSHSTAQAADPAAKQPAQPAAAAPVKKSGYNTNIFEKTEYTMNFSDTVKLVREGDITEIMFVKKPGFFTAPKDDNAMNLLITSQKSKSTVKVVVDEETRQILKVQAGGGGAAERSAGPSGN